MSFKIGDLVAIVKVGWCGRARIAEIRKSSSGEDEYHLMVHDGSGPVGVGFGPFYERELKLIEAIVAWGEPLIGTSVDK